MTTRVILINDVEELLDVTERVKMLYGHVTGSMDWSSGFYSTEEELDILEMGVLLETEDIDEQIKSCQENAEAWKKSLERSLNSRVAYTHVNDDYYRERLAETNARAEHLKNFREARAKLVAQTDDVTNFDE